MRAVQLMDEDSILEQNTCPNYFVVIQIAEGLQLPQLAASIDGQEVIRQATKKGSCTAAAHSNNTASLITS